MASIITATTTSGLTQSADNSGVLQLASGTGNLVTVPSVTGTAMVSGNMPAFSAYYSSGGQTIASSTYTKIILNSEFFDTASCFDSTTNYRFTPTVAGYYQINGQISVGAMSGLLQAVVYKNGSAFQTNSSLGNNVNGTGTSIATIVYLNGSTDYVELYAWQNSGSAKTTINGIDAANNTTWFNGSLVRSA